VGGSGEDDGYVVTLAVHAGSFESQCWIFSARDVDRGPLARVRLPARVPTGFHAKWIPGDKLWPNT
jgi:carotenoid cleavage dioxygenase